jgi:PAS domain S-box-containing protein
MSRSFFLRASVVAACGLVLAAAITVPLAFVSGRSHRIELAIVLALAVALVAGLAARRIRTLRSEAAARYRTMLETLPLVTWTYDVGDRGATREISPQIESLLGFPQKKWRADREAFENAVHPEDRQRVVTELNDAAAQGVPTDVEYRLLARDGRVVWVHEFATTVRADDGSSLYGLSYLVDADERRRAAVERDRVVSAEHAAVADAGRRQGRLDLLRQAAELLGSAGDSSTSVQRVAELAVRELADWCVVDAGEDSDSLHRVAVAGADRARTASGAPRRQTDASVRAVVENGGSRLVPEPGEEPAAERFLDGLDAHSLVCVPLYARSRRIGALTVARTGRRDAFAVDDVAFVEDLAGRIALSLDRERLLREVEERSEASRVLAHVADGVLLVDRTGVVRLWNPAAERITGIAAAEAVARPAVEVIHGWEDAADSVPVSAEPDPRHREVVIPIETAGAERWIAVSGVEFFGGTVYAFRDLTEVRRLEELKSDFIATASHELRTPLAAIYGAAQTLLRHDFALDEGGRDRFLSLIADESERLSRIVNEILLANQLDAGRLDFAPEPFDAVELVDRVVDAARAYAPPELSIDFVAPERVPFVAADRDKVRQVLVNLIENAIKYSADGKRIEISVEANGDNAVFSVSDEGLGIPPEERTRVFEKFYRVDPQMTRGVGGTGLGLYICRELVTRMGGRIWVEPNDGTGSTFRFELPLAERTEHAPARRIPARVTSG